jgi:hypothetical protein
MSRFMQIRLQIQAVYRPELGAHFPKLASALEELGIGVDQHRVTLYSLVRELERAVYGDARPGLGEALAKHLPSLVATRNQIDEKLSMWERHGLDELLYRMEDGFEDLERDLD